MSVINETLDNLKKTKKRAGNLNPSSSSFRQEKSLNSENIMIPNKAYWVPISFALVVGVLFYVAPILFPHNATQSVRKVSQTRKISWFKNNLHKQTAAKQSLKSLPVIENKAAQTMYYDALVLLNEGKDVQAMQRLEVILDTYPDFAPAQKVHAMLMTG